MVKVMKILTLCILMQIKFWAMIQDLPFGGFKFLNDKEINSLNLDSIAKNSPIGYILEEDVEYCEALHDSYSDYPLSPEKIEVSNDMLPKHCKDIADRYQIKDGGVKILIPNLGDKFEYVVHYKNLQYYLSLGIKLVKIHRILSFKQNNWLKKNIDFNTDKRKKSTDEFSRSYFKLMVNCIFGKSIENIRKRINVKLNNNKKTYQKFVNKLNFVSQKIFHKNFVAVHCKRTVLTLNKLIYVGFCILELLMYQFHYDYALKTFNSAKLFFTDADSLVYEIKNGCNIYDICFKDKHLFDFSGYPEDSVYYCDFSKKGKMKDELNGVKIVEFVGLESKIYSLISSDSKEINKAKGVNKKLRHIEYLDFLFDKKIVRHKMKRIQSNLHQIGTYDINKISLSCYDDKRYVLSDGVNTLAHFQKDII